MAWEAMQCAAVSTERGPTIVFYFTLAGALMGLASLPFGWVVPSPTILALLVLMGLVGLRCDAEGVRFQPCLPKGVSHVELRNLAYRRMTLDVIARGAGANVRELLVNGQKPRSGLVPAQDHGRKTVTSLPPQPAAEKQIRLFSTARDPRR